MVYVSNRGGPQLDRCRGTLDTLPELVKEVDGRSQVVVDGVFMRGTDVVKAGFLGAGRGLAGATLRAGRSEAALVASSRTVISATVPTAVFAGGDPD